MLCCCLNSRAGVDHGQYLKWSQAAVTADIEALKNEKDLRAVTQVPFSPWSPGPGLLIAPFYVVLSVFGLQQGAGLVAGYGCVLVFWLCFYHAVRLVSGSAQASLACLVAALATPIGHYCSSISAETYSLAPAAFLLWQAVKGMKSQQISLTGISAATAILLMIRSFLGIFAWPALWVAYCRTSSRSKFMLTTGCAVGAAMIPIFYSNYWMTGDWLHSPYSFGDASFQSFNWSAPYWSFVLFDPFHGLAWSHPLVLLGIAVQCLLVIFTVRRGARLESTVWSLFLLATVTNIYIQSCWFYWWLAMPSFGMRGLVLCGIPAVIAIFRFDQLLRQGIQSSSHQQVHSTRRPWLSVIRAIYWTLIGLCTIWGWLHLCEGPLNCVRASDLVTTLLLQILSWTSIDSLLAIGCSLATLSIARHVSQQKLPTLISTLAFLLIAFTARRLLQSTPNFLFVMTMSGVWLALFTWYVQQRCKFEKSVASSLVGVAVLMVAFFIHLWTTTSVDDSSTTKVNVHALQPDTDLVFNWPDARRAYLTLQQIPRLKYQRDQLRAFFARNFSSEFVDQNLPEQTAKTADGLTVTQPVGFFGQPKTADR